MVKSWRRRHSRQRDPRQQEPAAARTRARRVPRAGRDHVATDVAARGVDIPGEPCDQWNCPTCPSNTSTASAGPRAPADGIAIAFCAEDERDYLKDIRKKTDAEFERLPLPDNSARWSRASAPPAERPRMASQRFAPPATRQAGQAQGQAPARKGRPRARSRRRRAPVPEGPAVDATAIAGTLRRARP